MKELSLPLKKGYKSFFLFFNLWILVFPAQAQIYKSVNAQGKVEYSDKTPAARNTQTKTLNLPDASSPSYIQPDWQEKELAVQKRLNEMQQKQEKERIARERQQEKNREPSECEIAQRRHLAAREGRLYVSRGDGPRIKANTEADIHYFEQDALRLCK